MKRLRLWITVIGPVPIIAGSLAVSLWARRGDSPSYASNDVLGTTQSTLIEPALVKPAVSASTSGPILQVAFAEPAESRRAGHPGDQ